MKNFWNPKLLEKSGMEDTLTVVRRALDSVPVIDLHTHLFPPSHEDLFLWGPDELLTYHYLVAEFFQVVDASVSTPDQFFKLSVRERADLIWRELFIERVPISEACRGVLTTWKLLGLSNEIADKDLDGVRRWYSTQSPEMFLERVKELSNVRYLVMTNIPFDEKERSYWEQNVPFDQEFFKTALRVDELLENFPKAAAVVRGAGLNPDRTSDLQAYLREWAAKYSCMYMMISTAASFSYPQAGDDHATRMLDHVILPVAEELKLPLFLKCGTRRQCNPDLRSAGDHVGVADVSAIENLCRQWPSVKFVCTFLSLVNQHELAVLGRKFRNLHIYGCWWFLNNPSSISAITEMRLELLGSGFTANHSDCRIVDQLIYKWAHTKEALAPVIAKKVSFLQSTGWVLSEENVQQLCQTLLGGSFEAFIQKRLSQ